MLEKGPDDKAKFDKQRSDEEDMGEIGERWKRKCQNNV